MSANSSEDARLAALSVTAGGEALAKRLSVGGNRSGRRHILEAFRRVERSCFIDGSLRPHANSDCALPIGHAQTTSQPYIIARMLEMLLQGGRPNAVLEVGAGCGYQTALLSLLCGRVVAVERIGALARAAGERLRQLGYSARVVHGDGFLGYAAAAPYDGIVVCAAHAAVPQKLVEQLTPDGVLVMPLITGGSCRLVSINAAGERMSRREHVEFVPMLEGKT